MLEQLNGLNRILDEVMCNCIHRPITLSGNYSWRYEKCNYRIGQVFRVLFFFILLVLR